MKFTLPKQIAALAALLLTPLVLLPVRAVENPQPGAGGALPPGFSQIEIMVGGTNREALIYAPAAAATTSSPVVFVFHGHGGSSRQVARSIPMSRDWPEAISVYMQGLNTPGLLLDHEGKKPGWQHAAGVENDRDLKFVDAMLEKLKHDYKVDPQRIYATGHSNGGGFTYLLWETRPEIFAAFAPIAAATAKAASLKPKPALHVAGEKDPIVKFEWQTLTMDAVKKDNGCDAEGKPWADHCTIYPSKTGTPLVTFIHPGGHEIPPGAPAAIIKFFKEYPMAQK